MNDGHRTSTIGRPRSRDVAPQPTPKKRRGATSAPPPDSRTQRPAFISDFTSPIERTKQLVPQRRGRLVVAVFSIIIALAIGASLFVLPIKSWFQQRDDLSIRNGELDILTAANDQLQLEVDRLQTPAGIAEAAREEIDYVEAGERRITVLPPTDAAISLPTGWPFDLITGIVSLRREEAQLAAAAAVASTTASTTNHSSLAPGSAPPTVGSEPSSIDPVQG